MDFNITAAVWLGGRFYRLINKLYAGTDRYFLEQEFDVFVTQTHTTMTYTQADTEVGVGAMDSIQATDVECIQTHRVIRTCRNDSRKRFARSAVLCVHFGGRRPGRACFFTLNFGGPVDRRIFA